MRRLSHKQRTTGTLAVDAGIEDHDILESEADMPEEPHYSLGKEYSARAQRNLKSYGPKPDRVQPNRNGRRLNSRWMRGITGSLVCGKSDRANYRHPRTDVTADINRLKKRHPTALLSVTDLDTITEAALETQKDKKDRTAEDALVERADEEEEEQELTYVVKGNASKLEQRLANTA